MASVKKIISKNNETFYDYRTKKAVSTRPRIAFFMLVSVLCAFSFSTLDDAFISSVLTVQSILVGFSFSVLFFLVSSSTDLNIEDPSLEVLERVSRINTLSKELFFNVAYYNTVTILSVLVALLFILPSLSFPNIFSELLNDFLSNKGDFANIAAILCELASRFLVFLFFVVFIESMYTFYRIVRRVNFYFLEKLDIQKGTRS